MSSSRRVSTPAIGEQLDEPVGFDAMMLRWMEQTRGDADLGVDGAGQLLDQLEQQN